MSETMDLTILMPCLNEAETLGRCIEKAQHSLKTLDLHGEVLVADNGSTDGSIEIAERLNARVTPVAERGYGSALRGGIVAARGRWIIMGDADDSYDFSALAPFVKKLREGYDLVMGCRMPRGGGTLLPGAMPWKHRWIGNPALTTIGRLFFKCPAHDFHCGLRGFSAEAAKRMNLRTTGMEFASEMVIKATLLGMRIAEVPITLHKDGRTRPPHLRSWRDGWRHLRFMLLYSPRWLFLYPGLILALLSLPAMARLAHSPWHIGNVTFDTGAMAMISMALLVGCQLMAFGLFTKIFATAEGLLPSDPSFNRLFRFLNLERGILLSLLVLAIGLVLFFRSWLLWRQADYGPLMNSDHLRHLIPSATLMTLGIQGIFSSFFLSILGLKASGRTPPALDS